MDNARASLLRSQIAESAETFLHLIGDLPDDVLHSQPRGTANSIAATIGHVVVGLDGAVNGMLQHSAPVFTTVPHGLSELPPSGDQLFNWREWGQRVRVELPVTKAYAQAVFQSFDDYLAELDDLALNASVPSPTGERNVEWMLSTVVLGNIAQHGGEISVLKGLHGMKGYRF